jgi:hypothetical protein
MKWSSNHCFRRPRTSSGYLFRWVTTSIWNCGTKKHKMKLKTLINRLNEENEKFENTLNPWGRENRDPLKVKKRIWTVNEQNGAKEMREWIMKEGNQSGKWQVRQILSCKLHDSVLTTNIVWFLPFNLKSYFTCGVSFVFWLLTACYTFTMIFLFYFNKLKFYLHIVSGVIRSV